MIVDKVRIQNFRSYKDSGVIGIDKNITTLLAKNEQGKTNFLKALISFSKDYNYIYDDFCSYSSFDFLDKDKIPIITLYFKTTSEDKELLKKYSSEFSKLKEFSITKFHDNFYETVLIHPKREIKLDNIKNNEISRVLTDIKNALYMLDDDVKKLSVNHPPFNAQLPKFISIIDKTTDNIELLFNDNEFIDYLDIFYAEIRELTDKSDEINNTIEMSITYMDELKNDFLRFIDLNISDILLSHIPSFSYFTNIDLLRDDVNVDEYLNNKEKYKTFSNLFELANLHIENLSNKEFLRRRFETDEASTTITGLVNESWTQELIKINIGCDGDNLFLYIEDEIGARDPPSRRSDGFQWYLSFYINFMADTRGELEGAVLLLDNPGSLLHASGQKDLLKTLNKISKNNQIIITTHSPFLIDKNRLDTIRIVEKKKNKVGSKVNEKFYQSQYDALEPIRAAIGCRVSDSLFGSKNNVLVEGFSDRIYIEAISKYNSKRGHTSLDLSKILINCAGGADKIPWLASFIKIEKYDSFIILDNDNKGRRIKRELLRKYDIIEEDIYTLDMINEEYSGVDVEMEDLIDENAFNTILNNAYRDIFKTKLRKGKIDISDLPEEGLVINKYTKIFKDNDLGNLDKILVAKTFRELSRTNECKDNDLGEKTIENFNNLFTTINSKFE